MKKNPTLAVIIAFVIGLVIGAVGYYIYYESQMSEAEKIVRSAARGGNKLGDDFEKSLKKIGK